MFRSARRDAYQRAIESLDSIAQAMRQLLTHCCARRKHYSRKTTLLRSLLSGRRRTQRGHHPDIFKKWRPRAHGYSPDDCVSLVLAARNVCSCDPGAVRVDLSAPCGGSFILDGSQRYPVGASGSVAVMNTSSHHADFFQKIKITSPMI